MNIKWELSEPMPNYLWKESAKMSVGNLRIDVVANCLYFLAN
jgi:hypothetical protein